MSVALKRTTRRTFIAVAMLPALLAGGVFWTRAYYKETIVAVQHAQMVVNGIDKLLVALTDAESSQRGYFLTGKEKYLAPFDGACVRARQALADLRKLTADDRVHLSILDRLTPLVESKIRELNQTVILRNAGQFEEAQAMVDTDEGESLMRSVRTLAADMNAEEERLLRERKFMQTRADTAVNAAVLLFTLTALASLVWAARAVNRYVRRRDAAERALEIANRELDGKVQEIETLNQDLEARVQQRTAELTEANDNLRRSNDDLQRFAYVASHDLQEPLRMVGSFLGLLSSRYKGRLDQQADEYIHFAVDGARRLQEMITDLLAYSRAGTQALEIAETPLADVVAEAIRNLQASVEESRAEIVIDPNLPRLEVDRVKMTRVFQNLIGNALKFRKESAAPRVEIAAGRVDGSWRIAVKDNGVGFDPKYTDRIFEVFQRLHAIGKYPGNGIGLAICKRVVEGHGGRLWAESTPGSGATFYISLPARRITERSSAASSL